MELYRKETEKMRETGVAEPAVTVWASSVVFLPKKNGSLRFRVDHRRLNAVTGSDSYPFHWMDECTDLLGKPKKLSTLDANFGC